MKKNNVDKKTTHVLMVCLGNICRSSLAEGILQSKIDLAKLSHIVVNSAGTIDYHVGEQPDPRSIAIALENGVDIQSQQSSVFSISDFDTFDLIYVMDKSNYSDIMMLARGKEDKSKVRLILNETSPNQDKDVPDPYYGGSKGFENVYKMLDKACDKIIDNLR